MPFAFTHAMLWLIAGVVLLGAEMLGLSGIGLMFAGLGALTAGTIATIYTDLTLLAEWAVFGAATAVWAMLLWKPMMKFRGHTKNNGYKNIVGETAYIGANGLKPGEVGEATWSGTIMKAELAKGAGELAAGAAATVTDVAGNILVVKAKH